jgi:hypothetical protein
VESIPYEIKVLACLRRLGRGEVWDTIVELVQDLTCRQTLSGFFTKFVKAMRSHFGHVIHPPRSDVEMQSVLRRSARHGIPGCIGFMDGVHCRWEMCPVQWRNLSKGKDERPTVGWQCVVNHKRRFMSVMPGQLGSVNDITACKADPFVHAMKHDPLYRDHTYTLYDEDGVECDEKGLWLSVDGGYVKVPQLLVGDPVILDAFMNFWNHFMECERKHVECAFGILKNRFRILKLPILLHDFDEIDDMFFTCCILHNMCLDFDGFDDDWNLGGEDGEFSDDENHQSYRYASMDFDLHPHVDCTTITTCDSYESNLSFGSEDEKKEFHLKRDRIAKHWYYMYRNDQINFKA